MRTGYSTTDNAYRDVWEKFFASRWEIVGYGGDRDGEVDVVRQIG